MRLSHCRPVLQISMLWTPVFVVELLVAAVVVPMQFLSLLVVTLPVTLPIILDMQASAPAAVVEGKHGDACLSRHSSRLLNGPWLAPCWCRCAGHGRSQAQPQSPAQPAMAACRPVSRARRGWTARGHG